MKASLKFREDQKPLFRGKVPLSILGLPFQSGFAAGDSKELSLSLATLFDTGPALRLSYSPNHHSNPLSLVVKTGIGHFGSPIDAPMTLSAEFNLAGAGKSSNPSFFLHFKPQFGDFSIKKLQTSVFSHPVEKNKNDDDEDDGSIEVVERPGINGYAKGMTAQPARTSVGGAIDNIMTGMEIGARTVMPIRNGAVLKFRWGMKFPNDLMGLFSSTKEGLGNRTAAGIPLLVMNKIGIEHVVAGDESRKGGGGGGSSKSKVAAPGMGIWTPGNSGEVAEMWWYSVGREMEGLQTENGRLKQAVDDLRAEFAATKWKNDRRISAAECGGSSAGAGGGCGGGSARKEVAGDGKVETKKSLT